MRFIGLTLILIFLVLTQSCSIGKDSFLYPSSSINQISSDAFSLRDFIIEKDNHLRGNIDLTKDYIASYKALKASNKRNRKKLQQELEKTREELKLSLSRRNDSLYHIKTLMQRQWRKNKLRKDLVEFRKDLRKGLYDSDLGYLEFLSYRKFLDSINRFERFEKIELFNSAYDGLNLTEKPNSFVYAYYLEGYAIVIDALTVKEFYRGIKPLPVFSGAFVLGLLYSLTYDPIKYSKDAY